MDPKLKLEALAREAAELAKKAATPDFTAEDADRAEAIAKEHGELTQLIARRDAAAKSMSALQVTEPVQDNADEVPTAAKAGGLTLGEQFVNSAAYKAFKERHPDGAVTKGTPVDFRVKDVSKSRFASKASTINTGAQGNAAPVRNGEVDDLVYRPERRLLDVITRGTTGLSWFQYRQIISKTNNASIVGEAVTNDGTTAAQGLKPLSSLTTALADAKAFTYADGMEVTNQELSDDGIMQSLINGTLTENLEIEIENILLNGAGTADEPAGILNTSGVLQQAFVTDAPTSMRKAITKLRTTSQAEIRGILLNPEDDESWDLLKDSHGDWIGNGPYGTGPNTAWGYERIVSQAIPVGQALIGDFKTIHLLIREALEILAFNQHKDYAQRNLTYVRAELRAVQLIRNAARLAVVQLKATP